MQTEQNLLEICKQVEDYLKKEEEEQAWLEWLQLKLEKGV